MPLGGAAHTQSESNDAAAHVAPPSVEAWNSNESAYLGLVAGVSLTVVAVGLDAVSPVHATGVV